MGVQRRAKGDGGIGRHKDGRFYGSLELPKGPDGSRRRKWVFGKSKAEVRAALANLKAELAQGADIAAKPETVAAFLRRWLDEVVQERCRPRTVESYTHEVNAHIIPHIGGVELSRLSPREVQSMVTALRRARRQPKRGEHIDGKILPYLSPRQVEYARAVLQRALNVALKWRLVTYNAATLVDGPPQRPKAITVLDEAQARALLAALAGTRLDVLFCLVVALGLRRGEACGLRWGDIDLERGILRVAQQVQRIGGALVTSTPKSERGVRAISLAPQLVALLRAHRQRQTVLHELVFTTESGKAIDPRYLNTTLTRVLAAVGLPHMGVHGLRHSAATFLIAAGADIRTVADVLGHSSPAFTLATYVHSSVERQRAPLGTVARLVDREQGAERAA